MAVTSFGFGYCRRETVYYGDEVVCMEERMIYFKKTGILNDPPMVTELVGTQGKYQHKVYEYI